jgi:hypothetical protein
VLFERDQLVVHRRHGIHGRRMVQYYRVASPGPLSLRRMSHSSVTMPGWASELEPEEYGHGI